MINKEKMEEKCREILKVAQKYDLKNIETAITKTKEFSDKYKVHVLMIGGYSAGKSALLNKYIGKPILEENIGPETNVATELYFSEKERIVANYLDGDKKEILDRKEINVEKVRNVERYIDSENLKTKSDYVFVDTPGFDSGIEQHNKALMQYIDNGTVFILVVDCERGTISESALNFLYEVSRYSRKIAIIINKCDKKIVTEIDAIAKHVSDLIDSYVGEEFPIICTSIFDEDVADKMKNIVEKFDAQMLYDEELGQEINSIGYNLVSSLILLEKQKKCNTEDIEEEINSREKTKKKIYDQLERRKKEISNTVRVEVKDRILGKIETQLMCNTNKLAQACEIGIEVFQTRVIEIIRPTMINEMNEYAELVNENFLNGIKVEPLKDGDEFKKTISCIEGIMKKLDTIRGEGKLIANIKVPTVQIGKSVGKAKGLYKTVTSVIGLTTSVVAPWVEVVIFFLPEIIEILNGLFGKSKEEKLAEEIQYKVIPQIISRMRTEIDGPLSEMEDGMLESVQNTINELLSAENEALEIAKNKKNKKEEDFVSYIQEVDDSIKNIKEVVKIVE